MRSIRTWRRVAIMAIAAFAVTACATIDARRTDSQRALPSWAVSIPAQSINHRSDALVVWISGDGGWGRMEREATSRLAAEGVPTLGVDSLRYFANKREPREAARAISNALTAYDPHWMNKHIILVGFSFGADIGPFVVRDLPPEVRAHVVEAAFLSPARRSNLQVSPASWLGIGLGPEVWPVMSQLSPTPVLCVGGAGIFADICPPSDASPAGMVSVRLGGGHILANQYDTIVRLIMDNAHSA